MFSECNKHYLSLKDVKNDINRCNVIKYAAYRAAAKLRVLQRAFYMDKVQLKVISCVLERHQLYQTENTVHLDQEEVDSVLWDIYFIIKKENVIPLDVNHVSQMMFSFLLDVFDRKTLNTVQVFSFKVTLTLLCDAKPRDKYHYLFEQLADHNNCLSRKKLELVLMKMIKLTEYLGEALSFGLDLVAGTVESCFQYNTGGLRLSEDVFMKWLLQDPQLLVWLSTLYRIQISETVTHNVRCEICKIYPLIGLRYRCLRCLSYDMCQSCFFNGKINKKHKLKHPVQEYCCPMTSQQATKAFLLTLKNRLYKTDSKLQYLPAIRTGISEPECLDETSRLLDEMEISSKTMINGSRISLHKFPYRELQNIILQLEKESEKILPQIDNLSLKVENSEMNEWKSHLKNCLMKHKAQVKLQVERLKILRNYLVPNMKAFVASTPVVEGPLPKVQKKILNEDLGNLSPITLQTCKKGKKEINVEKKMLWDNYDLVALNSNASWEEVLSHKQRSKSFDVPEMPNTSTFTTEAAKENELELSSWLTEKNIRELSSSSKEGVTWLYENDNDIGDSFGKDSEVKLKELQSDLKEILKKLKDLSVLTFTEEITQIESLGGDKNVELDIEVDTLLKDLIGGIEKLIGS